MLIIPMALITEDECSPGWGQAETPELSRKIISAGEGAQLSNKRAELQLIRAGPWEECVGE